MLTHLLDTSAWLAHALREPGSEVVHALLLDTDCRVAISAISLLEFHSRLRQLGIEARFNELLTEYRGLFAAILPVDEQIAGRAVGLRSVAIARIPAIDTIIAGTAAHHNAILVHRDAHFAALAAADLRQQPLGGGSTALGS